MYGKAVHLEISICDPCSPCHLIFYLESTQYKVWFEIGTQVPHLDQRFFLLAMTHRHHWVSFSLYISNENICFLSCQCCNNCFMGNLCGWTFYVKELQANVSNRISQFDGSVVWRMFVYNVSHNLYTMCLIHKILDAFYLAPQLLPGQTCVTKYRH